MRSIDLAINTALTRDGLSQRLNVADKFAQYKKDWEALVSEGQKTLLAFQKENFSDEEFYNLYSKEQVDPVLKKLKSFSANYQSWYSKAKALLRQLLPDRLDDFVKLYEKPKTVRKNITFENYSIEDALTGLLVREYGEVKLGPRDAQSRLIQQMHIVEAIGQRFESSLFDIKQLVQADLFDTELDTAKNLLRNGYTRAAGAIAGVVLEAHLKQVCENHKISIRKAAPTISDFNDRLKSEEIIEAPMWRKIQYLGDIRNTCSHKKNADPKEEDVEDMIASVEKVIKNLF